MAGRRRNMTANQIGVQLNESDGWQYLGRGGDDITDEGMAWAHGWCGQGDWGWTGGMVGQG